MHSAPSVSYPVGRSRIWGLLLLLAACLGLAAVLVWSLQVDAPWPRRAGVWVAWLAAAMLAGHRWWRSPRGELAWDGQGWAWRGQGAQPRPGRVELALDLQRGLLLRWSSMGHAPAWLWLERKDAPAFWHDLRRAVYSPTRPEAPRQDGAAAKP